jgi:hypothetical protein
MAKQFVIVFVALLASIPITGRVAPASEHDHLVAKHAAAHGVPESLVRRVIHIESKGNPRVVSSGNYGLMQIRLGTARAMGYSGDAGGLLNADTNMTYAVRYLAGAYRAAGGNHEQAIRNYQRGYYARAKAQGFSPYAAPSAPLPQPAAPDPTLLRQPQEIERQQIVEKQRLERQAMLEARIAQQRVAEEERMAQRQAALQARVEQQRAAEQARIAQRQAALQERLDRQQALQQQIVEQRNAAEQRRAEQRQAILQQRIEREQARQQQRIEREQARQRASIQPVGAPRIEAQAQLSARPLAAPRRVAPAPSYAWYNPMRYFKHPSHQANPLPRDR